MRSASQLYKRDPVSQLSYTGLATYKFQNRSNATSKIDDSGFGAIILRIGFVLMTFGIPLASSNASLHQACLPKLDDILDCIGRQSFKNAEGHITRGSSLSFASANLGDAVL